MYYLKDIILGLRKEYLNNEKRLEKLKDYIIYDYNKVKDYNINSVFNLEVVNLIIEIERRQSIIEKTLEKTLEKLELIEKKNTTIKILDTRPYIEENAFGLRIDKHFTRDFSRIVRKIKNEDTIYRIGTYQTAYQEKEALYYLNINPQFIDFTILDDQNFTTCFYDAKEDSITIKSNAGKIDLEEVFYRPIEKERIPIYNQSVINESLDKNEFNISKRSNSNEIKLKIKEYDNGYYLRKVNG